MIMILLYLIYNNNNNFDLGIWNTRDDFQCWIEIINFFMDNNH